MKDIFVGVQDDQESISLLGYQCPEAVKNEVRAYLDSLSPEEHSPFCEWAPYGLDLTVATAEDIVIDQAARRRGGEGEATEEWALRQLDDRLRWLEFVDNAETLAWLEDYEPEDNIGENDTTNLRWKILEGGAKDYALHCMIEYAQKSLRQWQQHIRGESKFMHVAQGFGGILERMYEIGHNNSPEVLERKAEQFAVDLTALMDMLMPMGKAVLTMLDNLGITPEEAGIGEVAELINRY